MTVRRPRGKFKIKLTRVQCSYMRNRIWHRLKPLLKKKGKVGEEARRLDAIWEKLLGWGTGDKAHDLRKLNDLELALLADEIGEFCDRTAATKKLKRTRRSLRATLTQIEDFNMMSAVDRLADLTK